MRRGLQSNPGEGGGAKHHNTTAPRAKPEDFSHGLGLEGAREKGRGRDGQP